jgi:L-iditol 2-dehydrogenase
VVACLGGDATRIEQREVPSPGPGELLLAMRAVGLCGTDLFKLDTGAAAAGSVLGHELVGEVIECGDGVDDFAAGDRVAVPHHVPCGHCVHCRSDNETLCATFRENLMRPGGFSDLVLIQGRAVSQAARRLPPDVADDVAVWMEPAACVLRGIDRSGLAALMRDDTAAVVQGAGSMGALHLLVLKALRPATRVAVVDPQADRRALALRLGADLAVAPQELVGMRGQLNDGHGADVVFDTVGGAGALQQALGLTREGGSVVLFAHAPPGEQAGFDINTLFKYERRIVGSYSGTPAEQSRILALMSTGRLDPTPLVSHHLDLSRFDQAVRLSRERRALKIIFTGAHMARAR